MQRIFSYRQLANLIFPLIVEQILMGAIGALDVIMVAQLGENAVSGVSLVTSIDQLIISTIQYAPYRSADAWPVVWPA